MSKNKKSNKNRQTNNKQTNNNSQANNKQTTNNKQTKDNSQTIKDINSKSDGADLKEQKTPSNTSQDKFANEEPKPKLSRAQKFFKVFDKLGDLFFLNLYFVFTCIPIITIGASFTALYTVTNKMSEDEEGPVRQEYFAAFKSNFKQSTAIWLIDLLYIASMTVQYYYYMTHEDQIAKFLFILIGFEFILFAFAYPLQFPLAARYENTTLNIIKNALILSVVNLGLWFRMFFIWMFPVALYYLRPNFLLYTWYLWFMLFTAVLAYACSMFLVKFYKKLENREEEE